MVPDFSEEPEEFYARNNKSFVTNIEFGKKAVKELVRQKRVKIVSRSDIHCVNPLTVATNSKNKKRLCIDLSRSLNKVSKKKKFQIESTDSALAMIEEDSWCAAFDLKAAYHHIRLNENVHKYFSIHAGTG